MKKLLSLLVLVGVVAGGAAFYTKYLGAPTPSSFRTVPVKRGDLSITISATGTLEPEEVVDVGAQVVGPILNLGPDPRGATDPAFKDKKIDYGSPVDEGTVLAQIDPAVYKANLNQAQATLLRAKCDLGQFNAHRNQAEAEFNRAQKLRAISIKNVSPTGDRLSAMSEPIKAISDSDYDLAKANYEVAKSNVEVGEATVAQAQAALSLSETNLGYTTIKSPVKGTIIDRRVNVGQTVVSSLSVSSLFLIAKDLRKIQVWASVNEADIGRLKVGLPVNFTVDAYPNDVFRGNIAQIRLNATMTQNVVTYTVVIETDNSDMKLLPYLTADLKFEVDSRKDVLLVPNSALRWQPSSADQIAPDARELAESPPRGRGKEASGDRPASTDKGDKGGNPRKPPLSSPPAPPRPARQSQSGSGRSKAHSGSKMATMCGRSGYKSAPPIARSPKLAAPTWPTAPKWSSAKTRIAAAKSPLPIHSLHSLAKAVDKRARPDKAVRVKAVKDKAVKEDKAAAQAKDPRATSCQGSFHGIHPNR